MEEWMRVIWLIIFVITMIIEVSITDLVSVWFSIAALITMCLSFIPGLEYWGEIIIFVVTSLILLIATRPFVRKFLKDKESNPKTNLETLIGQKFVVQKDIEKTTVGEIIVNGVVWDAESVDGNVIKKDTLVKITAIKGNKFIVEEVRNDD